MERWQVCSNVGATLVPFVTFLMVFVVQNTQNREAKALHLKLDQLLCSVEGTRATLLDLEDLTDEELDHLHGQLQRLHGRMAGTSEDWRAHHAARVREDRERDGAAA